MKKILSFVLIFAFTLTLVSCGKKAPDDKETSGNMAGNTAHVGDDTAGESEDDGNVPFSMPADFEFLVKGNDGAEIDLYTATAEELRSLSENKCDENFSSLQNKQEIANSVAEIFERYYPDKEVVHKGMTLYIKSSRNAKGLICHAEGADGGSACLAIDSQTGEVIMLMYID